MKRYSVLLVFSLIITCFRASAQHQELENAIQQAVQKAYAASVRVWAYDTVTAQQMGAQFSAVVVSPQGRILTAAHTTMPGLTYKVMFPDGRHAIAQAMGKIEMAEDRTIPDVSTMQIITPGSWPYAEMGYSGALKADQPCISIAYPESLNQPLPSVRFGKITNLGNERGFLQSTCIMEPGDSGGPLFDLLGRVIGLHSAINVPESLNYEIPVDLYRTYATALAVPKKYNAFPSEKDTFSNDPATAPQHALPATFGAEKNGVLLVTSDVKGQSTYILGAAFTDGHVVSKSSMVGADPKIQYEGKVMAATVVRRSREHDLVLLKVASIKNGIKIPQTKPDSISFQQLGKLLISPRPDSAGIVSVTGSLPFGLPAISSTGFLGASIAMKSGPLLLTFVRKNSPAAAGGLLEGDELVSINNIAISKAESYGQTLQQFWPGDTISLELKRKDSSYTKQVALIEKPAIAATHPAEMFNGGKSARRDGFARVFVHDAVLTPDQCGGPVLDATGSFKGINIARYSRTSTLVIPAEVVWEFLQNI